MKINELFSRQQHNRHRSKTKHSSANLQHTHTVVQQKHHLGPETRIHHTFMTREKTIWLLCDDIVDFICGSEEERRHIPTDDRWILVASGRTEMALGAYNDNVWRSKALLSCSMLGVMDGVVVDVIFFVLLNYDLCRGYYLGK